MKFSVSFSDLLYLVHNHGYSMIVTLNSDGVVYHFYKFDKDFIYTYPLDQHDLNDIYVKANKQMLKLEQ